MHVRVLSYCLNRVIAAERVCFPLPLINAAITTDAMKIRFVGRGEEKHKQAYDDTTANACVSPFATPEKAVSFSSSGTTSDIARDMREAMQMVQL